jgi:hypothetical protein
MGKVPQPSDIRVSLSRAISAERRDALLFSILLIILTPFFIAIAIVAILYGLDTNQNPLQSSRWHRAWPWEGMRWINAFNLFLYTTLGGFFLRSANDARLTWKNMVWWLAAGGSVAFVTYLSYSTPLRETDPRLFWYLYGGAGFVTLGFLGVGYVPSDDHFAPLQDLSFSDPTLSRPVEEVDVPDGFLTVIPGILFSSYGNVFGSFWLWHGLNDRGLWIAAEVLYGFAIKDMARTEHSLRAAVPVQAGRVIRWLKRLEFLRGPRERLELTAQGERFLGISEWTV